LQIDRGRDSASFLQSIQNSLGVIDAGLASIKDCQVGRPKTQKQVLCRCLLKPIVVFVQRKRSFVRILNILAKRRRPNFRINESVEL